MSNPFAKRTKDAWHNHAKRRGTQPPYTLGELRSLVERSLPAGCPYCRAALTAATFGLDHAEPTSRGGSWGLDNLVVCCQACNQAKGPLTAAEYAALLALLATWPEPAARDLIARLRSAGNRFHHRRKRA